MSYLKNKFAALSCWMLRDQFSPLDVIYVVFIGLAYRDFGLISPQLLTMLMIILCFHFLFRKITASIRLSYVMSRLDRLCKVNSIK